MPTPHLRILLAAASLLLASCENADLLGSEGTRSQQDPASGGKSGGNTEDLGGGNGEDHLGYGGDGADSGATDDDDLGAGDSGAGTDDISIGDQALRAVLTSCASQLSKLKKGAPTPPQSPENFLSTVLATPEGQLHLVAPNGSTAWLWGWDRASSERMKIQADMIAYARAAGYGAAGTFAYKQPFMMYDLQNTALFNATGGSSKSIFPIPGSGEAWLHAQKSGDRVVGCSFFDSKAIVLGPTNNVGTPILAVYASLDCKKKFASGFVAAGAEDQKNNKDHIWFEKLFEVPWPSQAIDQICSAL